MKLPDNIQWILDHPNEQHSGRWTHTLMERINSHIYPGDNGCVLWNGTHSNGYPMFKIGSMGFKVVRVRWYLEHGTWPKITCHQCDNRGCVALEHIKNGSRFDNAREAVERGFHWEAKRTECLNGHPYSPENMYIKYNADGTFRRRVCRPCHREWARQYKLRINGVLSPTEQEPQS